MASSTKFETARQLNTLHLPNTCSTHATGRHQAAGLGLQAIKADTAVVMPPVPVLRVDHGSHRTCQDASLDGCAQSHHLIRVHTHVGPLSSNLLHHFLHNSTSIHQPHCFQVTHRVPKEMQIQELSESVLSSRGR